jgi:hypothetical protein
VTAVAGSALALRRLRATGLPPAVRHTGVAALSLLVVGIGYVLLPESGDAVDAPAALVYDFRIRSLGLLALLYALLGVLFGAASERVESAGAKEHRKVLA